MSDSRPWLVLKFGGTSVSSRAAWETIAGIVRDRLGSGRRVLIVHSALSGVSNRLESFAKGREPRVPADLTNEIAAGHRALGRELGLDPEPLLAPFLAELDRLATGIALLGEASPPSHARLLAQGELLATALGAAFLAAQGIATTWLDARELLVSAAPRHASATSAYLSATCGHERDPALSERLGREGGVLLTQGFIARNPRHETVLLGRGGSDTSATLLGARLGAERVEIWTDVPGMFTADPRNIPEARLLRMLDYDEAQEIASMGAKVLHPRAIAPVRAGRIPLWILSTARPDLPGTVISLEAPAGARVKAVSVKRGVVLVAMETIGMWQQVGFLADAFAVFKRWGLSIDLVSSSETNVTVTLDPSANALSAETLEGLRADLAPLAAIEILPDCAVVSLVGRDIRAILHRLGPALELFAEQRIHLVSQAASDLNLSFVVDAEPAERLARQLHDLLIQAPDGVLGPTWAELTAGREAETAGPAPWWIEKRAELLALAARESPVYAYDGASLDRAVEALAPLGAVDRLFYAVKANPHPEILRRFARLGLGFECVSPGEIERVRASCPEVSPERILFTPNFAPRGEYERALAAGVHVTLDSLHPLVHWGGIFAGRTVFARLDLGQGAGHHRHVQTAGAHSKFGIPKSELPELAARAAAGSVRIAGLHSHSGSGILDPDLWLRTALALAQAAETFPEVRVLDLGGGLGVPEKAAQRPIDLARLAAALAEFKIAYPRFALWLEPGRFLVAEAGVLLATVTQVKGKRAAAGSHAEPVRYVGVDTGMNSLIRPALYGAHQEIVNLTRWGEPATERVDVVGPICESGDVLGVSRLLPETREGDVLLIATAGAYGHAMSSRYNLREPAREAMV